VRATVYGDAPDGGKQATSIVDGAHPEEETKMCQPNPAVRLPYVVAIILACLFTARDAGAQITDVIRGRVTGPDSTPLEGVTVKSLSLQGQILKSDVTDRNGRFSILYINGEGDYWLEFTRIGFAPQRRQIKRIGDEAVLIVDVRMVRLNNDVIDTVRVNARVPVPRALPNRNVDPDVGGGARALNNNDVSASQLGNLAAMAATLPGIQIVPGLDGAPDMYSVFGLSPDQNTLTFNGVGSGVSILPPDVIATTSIYPYSFDPSIGGFSGAQISIRTSPGSNFSRRMMSHNNILPPLQWTDAISAAQAQKFTTLRLGGNAAGPIVTDKAFYNTAYNVSSRLSDARTLFNTDPLGLAAAGVSADSVLRLRTILLDLGVPSTLDRVPGTRRQNNLQASANFDLMPTASGTGSSFTLGFLGNYSETKPVGQSGLLLTTPSYAGSSANMSGNGVINHTGYFSFGVLSKTTLGIGVFRSRVDPYLDLPSGMVRVRSELDDGTSPVKSLLFGGNASRSQSHSEALQLSNQLSWFSGANRHTIKVATSVGYAASSNENDAGLFGAFTFNSLEDLEAGRAASFSRTLVRRDLSTSQLMASASLGDYWRPAYNLQIQLGARVDANKFVSTPEFNPSVLSTFGMRNDATPDKVYVSPRVGLQWNYGNAPTVAFAPGAARPPVAVIHAGVGIFQNIGGPQLVSNAVSSTGLQNSTRTMACVGDAVPAPDWDAFLTNPGLIPDHCADGSSGTVFSTLSPSISLFDPGFRQQRALRAAADWSGPILDNRLAFGIQGVVTRALNQSGFVDINVDTTTRFTLAGEANRPVFAEPGAIVPETGNIAPGTNRLFPDFQRVSVSRSGLRLNSHVLNIGLSPVTANRFLKWSLSYTLLGGTQTYYGFNSTVGNPFHVERGDLQRSRHAFTLRWRDFPIADLVYVSSWLQLRSGAPYTPRIAGDVNGDGLANDRAFVPDPATATDPALAEGITSLLRNGPSSARECLARQLGKLATRGSCLGPWTADASLSLNFNASKVGLPKRVRVSLNLENVLAAADLIAHGKHDVRGWGQAVPPDQTLLYVRGFDPETRQFKYDVNQRFGSTSPQVASGGSQAFLSMAVNLDIGIPRERQTLTQRLAPGRSRPGAKAGEQSLWQFGVASIPNPMSMILTQADSLKLTRKQADSIAWLSRIFAVYADSTWTPAARALAALPDDYNKRAAYDRYVQAREQTVDYLLTLIPEVKKILTASQRRRLPLQISNYLDERVLKFLRSSSAGDASAVAR
jgi:hypothetical protein